MSQIPSCCHPHGQKTHALSSTPHEPLLLRLWICAFISVPLTLYVMLTHFFGWRPTSFVDHHTTLWFQMLLATPVVLWGAWPFYVAAFSAFLRAKANMFTLIALGVSVTYLYSLVILWVPHFYRITGGHVYFESSAMITTLVLLGQVLEARAKAKARASMENLLHLIPQNAHRLHKDVEEEIAIEDVRKGDILRVRAGDKIPVDGQIVEGEGGIDPSFLTGESIPTHKKKGDFVIGGALVLEGTWLMRAERVGQETRLAQIIELIEKTQKTQAPIQRLADRIASVFVPTILCIAGFTALTWGILGPDPPLTHAMVQAVAVLMISCPCALGLATPMSIVVATTRGAEKGVLVQRVDSLEKMAKIDVVVFDKTGTLTIGKTTLHTILPFPGFSQEDVLRWSASLEIGSGHPFALAIVAAARAQSLQLLPVECFASLTGKGLRGSVEGRELLVGSASFLEEYGLETQKLVAAGDPLREVGQAVVYVVVDRQPAAVFGILDPLKPEAVEVVRALREQGLRLVMLTGDHHKTAQAIAAKLGIKEVESDVLPEEKMHVVRHLQARGAKVAVVGDGINDAPALAQADVGIAMGTGTDIAIENAGIVLTSGNLRALLVAYQLSRGTLRNIKENLTFAFLYNVISIPIAAGALYPTWGLLLNPELASLCMALSSLSVILNAMRLKDQPLPS